MVDVYNIISMVDTNDRDGWWVGKVVVKVGDLYEVYFELTEEYIVFPKWKGNSGPGTGK